MKGGKILKKSKNSTADAISVQKHATKSVTVTLLDKLSNSIYNALKNGFFGRLFTSYSKAEESFENGYLKDHFTIHSGLRVFFRNIRKYLSSSFESSFFLNKTAAAARQLVSMPLKSYGNFLFAFGLYVIIVYILRLFLPVFPASGIETALLGLLTCIISIPMTLSQDNVASAVGKSKILGALFSDVFGFRDENFNIETKISRLKSNLLIILGILLGVSTLYISPLWIFGAILALIIVALIFAVPEIGVILSLFAVPFLSFVKSPAVALGILVAITIASYLVKLIRGKRIFKIELIDLSVVFFLVIIFLSGAITAGGQIGYNEALISCELMLGYFLIVNLLRTEKWVHRAVMSLLCSGVAVAIIGLIQYVTGTMPSGAWLDTRYFEDIKGRVVSVFDNPNVLAMYLVTILPFTLYALVTSKRRNSRLLALLSVASVTLCILLTWSRGAWIAAIICIALFLIMYSRKTVRYVFLSFFAIPLLPIIVPSSIIKRFLSIGDLADSSTLYRVYTWRGTLKAIGDHIWGGVGYGTAAFQNIYPQYAYAGIEGAEHSHNLYLQIIFGTGIVGIIAFLIVVFLYLQMNFEYIKNTVNYSSKFVVIASTCSVISMLVFGMFDFIWYNYRVLFLFWAVMALAVACVRIGKDNQRRQSINSGSDFYNNISVDI